MVVAVPVALVIERDHEQIGARERLELPRRAVGLRDCVTQRPVHPLEDRRAQQEPARIRIEIAQDLLAEVVDDMPVITGEPHDELVPVGAAAQRQPGEIHRRRPTFRTLMQRGHILVRELQTEEPVEQRPGFGARKAQLIGINLHELAPGPQARNLKRRLRPRRDRHADKSGEVVEQPPHPGVDRVSFELVVVVEREHERPLERLELTDQHRQHLADQIDAGRAQQGQRP
jgi:hypothetical protein